MRYFTYMTLFVAVTACLDSPTSAGSQADLDVVFPIASAVRPDSGIPVALMTGVSLPKGLPSEFYESTSLEVGASVAIANGYIRGDGWLDYWATDARGSTALTLLRGVEPIGTVRQERGRSDWLPATRRMTIPAVYSVDAACGYSGRAVVNGEVWNRFLLKLSLLRWGDLIQSNQAHGSQPPCQGPSSSSTNTNENGKTAWIEVCHYVAVLERGVIVAIEEHGCITYNVTQYAT